MVVWSCGPMVRGPVVLSFSALSVRLDQQWTKSRPRRAIRQRNAPLDVLSIHRPVRSAIRTRGPIVTQNKVLVRSKHENALPLSGKCVNLLGQIRFQQDSAVDKDVSPPDM